MSKKVYISGKITGLLWDDVVWKFNSAKKSIEKLGWTAVSPLDLVPDPETLWHHAMKEDIKAMMDCDELVMLHDWQDSKGALIEKRIAEELLMPVSYMDNCFVLFNHPLKHPQP